MKKVRDLPLPASLPDPVSGNWLPVENRAGLLVERVAGTGPLSGLLTGVLPFPESLVVSDEKTFIKSSPSPVAYIRRVNVIPGGFGISEITVVSIRVTPFESDPVTFTMISDVPPVGIVRLPV